uniref:Ig-like domain-containing protein n=1 Tax=Lates calcarifer TaxID=8187 RepID=A0A4W6DNC0_LATCA
CGRLISTFFSVLLVSQHALALQVEVYEGAESVLLPCRVSFFLEDTTVLWHCDDLYPEIVHSWRDERDELTGQDQRFRGRTSMASDGAESGDLSLTLRQPHLSDSGNYTCLIQVGAVDTGQSFTQSLSDQVGYFPFVHRKIFSVGQGSPGSPGCWSCCWRRSCHILLELL